MIYIVVTIKHTYYTACSRRRNSFIIIFYFYCICHYTSWFLFGFKLSFKWHIRYTRWTDVLVVSSSAYVFYTIYLLHVLVCVTRPQSRTLYINDTSTVRPFKLHIRYWRVLFVFRRPYTFIHAVGVCPNAKYGPKYTLFTLHNYRVLSVPTSIKCLECIITDCKFLPSKNKQKPNRRRSFCCRLSCHLSVDCIINSFSFVVDSTSIRRISHTKQSTMVFYDLSEILSTSPRT